MKIPQEYLEKLLIKYDTAKKIMEILDPFLKELKEEILIELIDAKTTEHLWACRGKLTLLTRIKNELEYIITKYEKERRIKND